MITTPAGIQKLMGETREELIARVCAQNVLIRRERAEAERELGIEKDKAWSARSEARQAREVNEPLRSRMVIAETKIERIRTVLDVLVKTGEIDEKIAGILRDDDNSL